MIKKSDKTVLVVDDEPELRELLRLDLEDEGYQVLEAEGGELAKDVLRDHRVDLIISDIRMPRGNGVDLLKHIKNANRDTPVVLFVTGFADLGNDEAYALGAEGVFSKPWDSRALMKTVERFLTPPLERIEKSVAAEPRLSSGYDVQLSCNSFSEALEGRILNIGRGGLFVQTTSGAQPKNGDTIRFLFRSDNNQKIAGTALVRWTRPVAAENLPAGFGAEFQSIDAQYMKELERIISQLATKAFIPRSLP